MAAMESKAFSEMFASGFLERSDALSFVTRIVDTMYDAVVVHRNGDIVFVNQSAVTMMGVDSVQQLLGRNVLEFVHPDDCEIAASRIRVLMEQDGASVNTEAYRLVRDDGKVVYAEVQASRLDGDYPQIMLVAHDVSAQYQHKEELSRIQLVVDQAVDAIYATDIEGNFTLINQASERLLKQSRSQLLGQSFSPYIAPEHLGFVKKEMQRKLDGRKPTSAYELEIIDCEGGRHPMENNSTIIRDADGKPIGVQGVLRDLSRRKRHEERIRILTQTMEHVSESIYITGRDGVVCYANRGACDMFQLDLQQIVGMYAAELRGGCCDDRQYQEVAAQVNAGKQWQKVLELPSSDGGVRVIARVISPIPDDEGNTQYHACIDRDITEQKLQQSQLEHVQRLESLGVLAGGIAHDFNNILTAIVGNVALAERKLQRNPLDARSHLVRIGQSAERAAVLCRQMLAYSGKGKFVIKRTDLSQEVRAMASLLEVSLHKQVVLKWELADDLLPVEADESQLQQLVMNLITNANEAIDGVGTIVLRTGMMIPEAAWLRACVGAGKVRVQNYVFMQVIDDGCGMDAVTRGKIFEPFFTTKFTGRGLGMSALLGIVRGHDGYIHLDSTLGKGTAFTILLPPIEVDDGVAMDAVDKGLSADE